MALLSGLPPQTNIVTKNKGVVKLDTISDKSVTSYFGGEINFGKPELLKTLILQLSTGDTITISENYPVPTLNGNSVLSQDCTGEKLLPYDSLHDGVQVVGVKYSGRSEYCFSPIGFTPILVTPDGSTSVMGLILYV